MLVVWAYSLGGLRFWVPRSYKLLDFFVLPRFTTTISVWNLCKLSAHSESDHTTLMISRASFLPPTLLLSLGILSCRVSSHGDISWPPSRLAHNASDGASVFSLGSGSGLCGLVNKTCFMFSQGCQTNCGHSCTGKTCKTLSGEDKCCPENPVITPSIKQSDWQLLTYNINGSISSIDYLKDNPVSAETQTALSISLKNSINDYKRCIPAPF